MGFTASRATAAMSFTASRATAMSFTASRATATMGFTAPRATAAAANASAAATAAAATAAAETTRTFWRVGTIARLFSLRPARTFLCRMSSCTSRYTKRMSPRTIQYPAARSSSQLLCDFSWDITRLLRKNTDTKCPRRRPRKERRHLPIRRGASRPSGP